MPVYERVDEHGQVMERVAPLAGDFEDTRLGLAVLDGAGGWRLADAEPPDKPDPDITSTPVPESGVDTPTTSPSHPPSLEE